MLQIQGELHISQRRECFCVLFTNKDPFIMVKIVEKEDAFWDTQMLPKLKQFYMECVLPEIVDSRQSRSMPIREPDYIVEAQNRKKICKEYPYYLHTSKTPTSKKKKLYVLLKDR